MVESCIKYSDIEWYGLRFGTINGYTPNLRSELMINSMFWNAITSSKINVTNKSIYRSIVGVEDLCRAINTIVQSGTHSKRGFYNLSSFSLTVDEISNYVSEYTGAKINYQQDIPNPYNFRITNDKFKQEFSFKFNETLSSVVDGLGLNIAMIENIQARNNHVQYWK